MGVTVAVKPLVTHTTSASKQIHIINTQMGHFATGVVSFLWLDLRQCQYKDSDLRFKAIVLHPNTEIMLKGS